MKKSVKIVLIALAFILFLAAIIFTAAGVYHNSPSYRLNLGNRYLSELNYEQAIIEFEKLVEIDPNNPEAWLKLAEAYEKNGQIDRAISKLSQSSTYVDDDRIKIKLSELNLIKNTVRVPEPENTTDNSSTQPPETIETASSAGEVTLSEIKDSVDILNVSVTQANGVYIYVVTLRYELENFTFGSVNVGLKNSSDIEYDLGKKQDVKKGRETISIVINSENKYDICVVSISDESQENMEIALDSVETKIDWSVTETTTSTATTPETTTAIQTTSSETTVITGENDHDTTLIYTDVSAYFDPNDVLYSIAGGRIINVKGVNEWDFPSKSVYVSDNLKLANLDMVFLDGLYWTETNYMQSNETPELVHNNGTHHVYKATASGAKLIKTSSYPMYITQDGYIAYYESRSKKSVTVNIESPSGKIISSTVIKDFIDPIAAPYGGVIDRLTHVGGLAPSQGDYKGAIFTYFISQDWIRNSVTGYNDMTYSRYLFYSNGKVVIDEGVIPASISFPGNSESSDYPAELTHSGRNYLLGEKVASFGDVDIVEYYDDRFNPNDYMDYYVDPEYAAYILVDRKTGSKSSLYKSIETGDQKIFVVTDFNGKKGYINRKGKRLATGYDDAGKFINDYSYVLENGKYYVVDRNLNKIAEINGKNVCVLEGNLFSCVKNKKVYIFAVG